jgi:hypothetical protein
VLLSEALNKAARAVRRDTEVTEEMIIFSCEACGRSVSAKDAAISRDGEDVLYGCPHDGAPFGRVRGVPFGSSAGYDFHFHIDGPMIRCRDGEVEWWELLERE